MFDPTGPVLGIDPGLSRCGYGAVRRDGSTMTAVEQGTLRTRPDQELPSRLAELEGGLEALVHRVGPSAMAVERVLFQANVRTAMTVGQASGLALAVAARAGVPVTHYSPNEVKLAVVGYGAAEKAQVQAMVTQLLGLACPPGSPDEADALALAVCHSWSGRVRAQTAGVASTSRLEDAIAAALAREDAR
jgi:crossover junction endodeoxyribonuclease RuvC